MNINNVVLGKDLSNRQRCLAYLSVIVVYFFYCYNYMISTFTKVAMTEQFKFSLLETEQIFASMSMGSIIGTFLFGKVCSRIGKKTTLVILAFTVAFATALPYLNPTNIIMWYISRITSGLALGGMYGTAMPLVADMFDIKYRAKLAASLTTQFALAMIFGGWIYGIIGSANWKGLLLTAIIPILIGGVMVILFVPSDRELTKQIYEESLSSGERVEYKTLLKGKYIYLLIGAIMLSALNKIGYAAYSNNATMYVDINLKLGAIQAGSIFSAQGIGQMIGYLFWGMISDKYGRRTPRFGMFLSGILIVLFTYLTGNPIMTMYITAIFIGFFIGFSGGWGAYFSEIFPPKFRTLTTGVLFNGGDLVMAAAIPLITLISASGNIKNIFIISSICFIVGSLLWNFLPETLVKDKKVI